MKVGLVVLIVDNKELGRAPRYSEVRDTALQAEAAGFDSLWLYDHLFYRPEGQGTVGIWECWTVLSALAEATKRSELGTLVVCTQFRNPAILAKMAITLDEVSEGRFILGIGAGWNQAEFEAFGIPFDHRTDRFEEAIQIIKPLLRDGRVDFEGVYYQARDCEIEPSGPRPDGPPLLIGTTGPRMLRLTARHADLWNVAYIGKPAELVVPRAALETACSEVGRDPASVGVTATLSVAYPELDEPAGFMDQYHTGSAEEFAAVLVEYERMGVAHVMIHCAPYNATALGRLADVVRVYREMSAAKLDGGETTETRG